MKASIISTYPANGSKNIGDKLIEQSTKKLLREVLAISDFDIIWREDIKDNVNVINQSSLMVYACLAVRNNMFPRVYNLPDELSAIKTPVIIISSGTSLAPSEIESCELGSDAQYDQFTIEKLREIGSKALGFSCRGEITFNVLKRLSISNLEMTGDVAFWEPRFDNLKFKQKSAVKKIAVSTPHYPQLYSDHFFKFLSYLRKKFPGSEIHIILHGITDWINHDQVRDLNCTIHEIYESDVRSLDIYLDMDVHIGYRVHAHVSALKRRIPSYLFAIDGRGMDYGKTLITGTTVKAWKINSNIEVQVSKLAKSFVKEKLLRRERSQKELPVQANFNAINYLVDLMKRDADEGFVRFIGYEKDILEINRKLKKFLIDASTRMA